jgi:hypothetical protein
MHKTAEPMRKTKPGKSPPCLAQPCAGAAPSRVTLLWRVIEPGATLAKKLRPDSTWLQQVRDSEARKPRAARRARVTSVSRASH